MTAVTFGETNPALEQFVTWYRERPTQLAFAASLLLHALLIAFIPGFRSVPLETPSVLTVQIVNTEPAPEKIPERKPVVRQSEPPVQPALPPEFVPAAPQPRVVEQAPVRPSQVVEPQPVPLLQQPEQPPVEAVARAQLAPAVPRQKAQIQPDVVNRPKLTPDQPVVPVFEREPVREVEAPTQQIAEVRREPRVVRPVTARPQPRPDVVPPISQPVQIQQPVEQVEAPTEQIAEVRREPRAVAPVTARPQPRPDVAPPTSQPVQIQQPVVAKPTAVEPVPVERAKPQVAPAAAPAATLAVRPSAPAPTTAPAVAAPVIAAPVIEAVEPSVLDAYRKSVESEVMRHMSYPRVAVLRKWQGKTVVEMQVSPDGTVTQIIVAESSGNEVLDDAALNMVRRSLPLPKPPRGVRTVKVPVVFRLQG